MKNLLRTPPERMTRDQEKALLDAGLFWDGLSEWVKDCPWMSLGRSRRIPMIRIPMNPT